MRLDEIDVIQFHPKHIEVAYLRERERKFFDRNEDIYQRIEGLHNNSFRSVTLMKEGRIITFCGFIQHDSKGVAEIWQIPSIYVKTYPTYYIRALRMFIDFVVKEYKLKRLQTTTPDDDVHAKFMIALGFRMEGTMKGYGPSNEDFKLWGALYG